MQNKDAPKVDLYSYLALAFVMAVYAFVWQGYEKFPIHFITEGNADVMLIEDVARDLNSGGHLADWRLTQAPYLFPDIFVARIMAAVGFEHGAIAMYYQFLLGLIVVGLLYVIARLAKVNPIRVVAYGALIFSASFWGVLHDEAISLYFGLIGCHSGISVPALAATIFIWMFAADEGRRHWATIGIFLSLALGVASDSIVVMFVVPGAMLYALVLFRNRKLSLNEAAFLVCIIFSAVLFGKLYSYLSPFPQDREFLAFYAAQFPHLVAGTVKTFFEVLIKYTTHYPLSLFLLCLTLYSYAVCVRTLYRACRNGERLDSPVFLMSAIAVTALPIVMATQLALGLYVAIDSSRQWAPIVYYTIVTAAIARIGDRSKESDQYALFTMVLAAAICLDIAHMLAARKGELVPESDFATLVNCMNENNLPAGWKYQSDFWLARPTSMFSNGKYGVVPYSNGSVYSNASNIKNVRHAKPIYVISGKSAKATDYISQYGAPSAIYCKMTLRSGDEVQIMDYSQNAKFMEEAQGLASKVY